MLSPLWTDTAQQGPFAALAAQASYASLADFAKAFTRYSRRANTIFIESH